MPRVGPVFRMWTWLGRRTPILLALALAPSLPGQTDAPPPTASAPYSAEAVRALYVLNFIRLTEWPASALPDSAPYVIGISGYRALEDELYRIADRQIVRDRRLRIIRVRSPRDLESCHLVYFGVGNDPVEEPGVSATDALPILAGKPVLTVSESPNFLAKGGMINLFREGGNLRFEIATTTVEKAGLTLSSRLLALARIVRATPPDSETPVPPAP